MKLMTPSEAETKRRKAVEFLRRIGRDDAAERFEGMDAAEYAEHKGAQLLENPTRRHTMKRVKTKTEIEAELETANDYIEELETKLDSIAGIAAGDEDEEDDDEEEDDDD
jgi:hypothetical protein